MILIVSKFSFIAGLFELGYYLVSFGCYDSLVFLKSIIVFLAFCFSYNVDIYWSRQFVL